MILIKKVILQNIITSCQEISINLQCLANKYKIFISSFMIKKIVPLFGHTQTAKSSSIKDLTGDQSIICGNGSGLSTTKTAKIYHAVNPKLSSQYVFIDTMGTGDNTLRVTPQKIREEIQLNILSLSSSQKCDQIQGIIITQSIRDSSFQLPNTLQLVSEIFGFTPRMSIVVIGTKSQNEEPEDIQIRQNMIKEKMRQFGIPQTQYMRFATTYNRLAAHQINQQQYAELEARLNRCTRIQVNSIHQKRAQINNRALQIQKKNTKIQNKPYTHTWTVEVWNGPVGKLFGKLGKKTETRSETRYNRTVHQPPLAECYATALNEYQTGVKQRLLVMH